MRILISAIIISSLMAYSACNNKPEIQPVNNSPFVVYPNPATDYFNISVNNPSLKSFVVQVFDTKGKTLFYKMDDQLQPVYTVQLSGEPRGTYHVVLQLGNSTSIQKFVKI